MKKTFILLTLFISICFSKTTDQLLDEALELENQKNYKAAMEIYKEIALNQTKINRVYVDEKKLLAKEITSTRLNKIEDKETQETIEQILSSSFDLYAYEDNYLLPLSYQINKSKNRKQSEVKFQISVKKPITKNLLGLNEIINFGYTQTSWWQLYKDSAPFRETNYKPEIFVEIPYGKADENALKGFKLGFLHESNGQEKEKSRSWNRVYLTSYFQQGNLFIAPKIWYRIPEKKNQDDNPDIHNYLGYGDLTLIYPYKKHTFKLLLRNNLRLNKENKGFAQLDWTFPFFGSKNSFGFIQASSGYGDSLIDYDKEINRIGFGLSLSR